jgi:protein SCO1
LSQRNIPWRQPFERQALFAAERGGARRRLHMPPCDRHPRRLRWRKDNRASDAQTRSMTTKRLLAVLLVAVAATVTVARARRVTAVATETRTYAVVGVVTASPADGRVTVAHEHIPDYMPAMTMPFVLGPGAPARLAPGDTVRFTLRVAADWSRAEDIRVVGRDATVAGAAAGAAPIAGQRLKKGDRLPVFSLTDEASRAFTNADLRGRLTAVTFIFTRCPVPEFCPLMVKRFQQLQRELQRDPTLGKVRLLSVTLDPGYDTPAILGAYAKAMGASPERWRFVTGEPAEIAKLTKAFAVHTERNGVFIGHTLATAIVDADGRLVEIWRGNGWTAADILEALHRKTARGAPALATPRSSARRDM